MDSRLTRFCEGNIYAGNGRYDLDEPWHLNGWDYATDGRIAVRIPALPNQTTEIRERRVPHAARVFGHDARIIRPDWKRWPKITTRNKRVRCPFCSCGDGAGKKHVVRTFHDLHNRSTTVLPDEICPACEGKGKVPLTRSLAGRRIGGWYLLLIGTLDDAEYCEDGRDAEQNLIFRASGELEGRVCPLKE